jgi:hypothetical protein
MSGTERKNQTKLKSIAPQFAVPDVVAAAEYYRDILGFRILGYFGQPTVFSIVARDNVEIQLGKSDPTAGPAPNSVQREDGLDAYVWVTDVDSSFAELRAAQISSNRHNSASTTATKWSSKSVSVPLGLCPGHRRVDPPLPAIGSNQASGAFCPLFRADCVHREKQPSRPPGDRAVSRPGDWNGVCVKMSIPQCHRESQRK